ncbi:MAG TPA: hypothetical protein VGK74_07835 [Symbiobacteriaceae bacterium]
MQNWDRLVIVVVGGGVAAYTVYGGWGLWKQQQRGAAVGAVVLAVVAVALPLILWAVGG